MEKKRKTSGYFDPPPQTHHRLCETPGCHAPGEYKAPKSRHSLNEYRWFCLDHVREYNASWDYFKGLSADEVEEMRRSDSVWERPSWPFGSPTQYQKFKQAFNRKWHDFAHAFGLHDEDDLKSGYAGKNTYNNVDQALVRALHTLELAPPVDIETVKRQYKVLVKKFHPDLNGGDKLAEERFKSINEAFQILKRAFGDFTPQDMAS